MKVWRGFATRRPPLGDLRWSAPQPPQSWTEVADATAFGPVSSATQSDSDGPGDPSRRGLPPPQHLGAGHLVSRRWASGNGVAPRGAYMLGSGSQPLYDGSTLAAESGVIVVTVNYRLGALGFVDLSGIDSRCESNVDYEMSWRLCAGCATTFRRSVATPNE